MTVLSPLPEPVFLACAFPFLITGWRIRLVRPLGQLGDFPRVLGAWADVPIPPKLQPRHRVIQRVYRRFGERPGVCKAVLWQRRQVL